MSKVTDSILLSRLRGEKTARVPVWFMRQAGRFLPEYRELRKQHSMLDAIRTPEIAAEISLQPLRRFDLDAGIIFADILNPLIGMGIELDFIAGEGPKIFNPVANAADVARLTVPKAADNVGYTLKAIDLVSTELAKRNIPLMGFSGAPFTLCSYLVKETETPSLVGLKRFIMSEPEAWAELQVKLGTLVADYLVAQVEAGAAGVQLFDSWAGVLSPAEFGMWAVPTLQTIVKDFKSRTSAPLIYFSTGTTGLLPSIATLGFDAIGVDWRVALPVASQLTGGQLPLQGNLDPVLLDAPMAELEGHVLRILREGDAIKSHIFNVGHGLLPQTDPVKLARVIEIVHGFTGA